MTYDDWDSMVADAESWYDYLDNRDGSGATMKNGQVPDEDWALPGFSDTSALQEGDVAGLMEFIRTQENAIAESLGYESWRGPGMSNTFTDAASHMGLNLKVEQVDKEPTRIIVNCPVCGQEYYVSLPPRCLFCNADTSIPRPAPGVPRWPDVTEMENIVWRRVAERWHIYAKDLERMAAPPAPAQQDDWEPPASETDPDPEN